MVWLITGLITALAGALRLVHLGRPSRLVFDETYYVKQAYSLLHLGYEGHWGEGADARFAAGIFTDLSTTADYVVHPAVGKWMIAAGMALAGPGESFSWRIAAAITGTLSVILTVLIGRHLLGHIIYGAAAGLFLAVDGIHLVMSRTSILDIFLSFWVLAGFGALLLDRAAFRRSPGRRWWLVVAGICLGLATGVKWSGIYFLAVFGLISVAWSIIARREAGVRRWLLTGILRDGVISFLILVPTAALTYLATWIPWLSGGYMRDAEPTALGSLVAYHGQMWEFHTTLTSEHTYMSSPWGWLLQARPTSFAWQQVQGSAAEHLCGSEHCASSILAVGNPIVWWGGTFALIAVVWAARRDWRAWAILAGLLGGYAPWFLHGDRTVFTFYTVAFVPFIALALAYAVAASKRLLAATVIAASVAGAYFWPVWTAAWVPYWYWQAHMFFPSWI